MRPLTIALAIAALVALEYAIYKETVGTTLAALTGQQQSAASSGSGPTGINTAIPAPSVPTNGAQASVLQAAQNVQIAPAQVATGNA